jgi:MFS family permease
MGVYQALYSTGMLTGPLFSGLLADGLGIGSVFFLSAGLSFLCGGLGYGRIVPRR